MKLIFAPVLLVAPAAALAQTAEDAHIQHVGRLADAALNAQYRSTMARMAKADRDRDAELKKGGGKPDGQPTYQAALVSAERAWLAYRNAHCASVSLAFRGGAYADEAGGKCVAELARKRAAELKDLSASMTQ